MAQLIVTQSHDYRGETLTDITEIVFDGTNLFATFGSNQFGGTGISNNVMLSHAFTVDHETMRVILSAPGAFSAAGWTFNGFNPPDAIELIGTSGADTITGTSSWDRIVGGDGADTLSGGDGLDWFQYFAGGEAAAGEVVNGDAGVDALLLGSLFEPVPGTLDFTQVVINSVEELRFFNGATAIFTGAQAAAFVMIEGSTFGLDHLIVNGSSVDLSAVNFQGWGPGGGATFPPDPNLPRDIIEINGTAGANSLTGSEKDDIIRAGAGNDIVAGGPGDDRIVYATGDGADTVVDFVAGAGTRDRIDVGGVDNPGTFVNLLALTSQVGTNAVIDFGGGDTLTLQNVQKTSLTRDDFVGLFAVRQDFNNEGRSDILWRHENGGLLTWDGGQVNDFASLGSRSLDWQFAGDGDFNGDATADILWRNTSGAVEISEMASNGFIHTTHSLGVVGNDWHIADTGYFNGDDTSDILWRHDSGQLAIWDINDGAQSGYHFLGFVGQTGTSTDTGDFNGDGQTDILWRHTTRRGRRSGT